MESRDYRMFKLFSSDFEYDSIYEIPIPTLKNKGIRGLLIDLDNTLAPWNDCNMAQEVIDWFNKLKAEGIKACILSNNTKTERVSVVAEALGIMFVSQAAKPSRRGYQMGIEALALPPAEIAVIGDQVFTDVFGGNRMGMITILVHPMCDQEYTGTKVLRFMERITGRKTKFTSAHLGKNRE